MLCVLLPLPYHTSSFNVFPEGIRTVRDIFSNPIRKKTLLKVDFKTKVSAVDFANGLKLRHGDKAAFECTSHEKKSGGHSHDRVEEIAE